MAEDSVFSIPDDVPDFETLLQGAIDQGVSDQEDPSQSILPGAAEIEERIKRNSGTKTQGQSPRTPMSPVSPAFPPKPMGSATSPVPKSVITPPVQEETFSIPTSPESPLEELEDDFVPPTMPTRPTRSRMPSSSASPTPRSETTPTHTVSNQQPVRVPSGRSGFDSNYLDELTRNVHFAKKIIKTVDVWRNLSLDEREFAAQFIGLERDDFENEAEAAVRTISVDPVVFATFSALKEAKAADPVDRVILVLKQDKKILQSLGEIVSAFTGNRLDSRQDKYEYARLLVKDIDNLSNQPMELIESIEELLSAPQKD